MKFFSVREFLDSVKESQILSGRAQEILGFSEELLRESLEFLEGISEFSVREFLYYFRIAQGIPGFGVAKIPFQAESNPGNPQGRKIPGSMDSCQSPLESFGVGTFPGFFWDNRT